MIDSIPEAQTVIYNQMIFIPNQKRELAMLDKKKNRHASIPNPSNEMAVEDIKRVQETVAKKASNWFTPIITWWYAATSRWTCRSRRTIWRTASGV
jgi:hypothetical protein